MAKVKVAINGFGRIGRLVLRAAYEVGAKEFEFVATNDLTDAKTLGHLFKYDSIHGIFDGDVEVVGSDIVINGNKLKVLSERDITKLPWKELGVDIVVESTGLFTDAAKAVQHITNGAKKVVISAPAKQEDITIVMGVNNDKYDSKKHNIISNASCTTNCLAPVAKVIHEKFTIKRGLMTTIHSYTNDQKILDFPHKDLRRARAAAMSMIPTTTGAAKAVGLVLPDLKGKLNGFSMRVPTPDVSVVDLVVDLASDVTVESVNAELKKASEGYLKGILGYTDEPLVSIDFLGNPLSSIVDGQSTMVMENNMLKVIAWYDNEWGFSCRMIDLLKQLVQKL